MWCGDHATVYLFFNVQEVSILPSEIWPKWHCFIDSQRYGLDENLGTIFQFPWYCFICDSCRLTLQVVALFIIDMINTGFIVGLVWTTLVAEYGTAGLVLDHNVCHSITDVSLSGNLNALTFTGWRELSHRLPIIVADIS